MLAPLPTLGTWLGAIVLLGRGVVGDRRGGHDHRRPGAGRHGRCAGSGRLRSPRRLRAARRPRRHRPALPALGILLALPCWSPPGARRLRAGRRRPDRGAGRRDRARHPARRGPQGRSSSCDRVAGPQRRYPRAGERGDRRRVRLAAAELDYRPNPIARGLKTNRSYTIGVLIPDLTNPLFPPILRGIEDRLEEAGYTALIANTDNDPERELLDTQAMRARQVDGIITATARRDHGGLDEMLAAGLDLVLVNRWLPGPAARPPGTTARASAWRSSISPSSAIAGSPTWPGRWTTRPASTATMPSGDRARRARAGSGPCQRGLHRGRGRAALRGCSTEGPRSRPSRPATTCLRWAVSMPSRSAESTARADLGGRLQRHAVRRPLPAAPYHHPHPSLRDRHRRRRADAGAAPG